MVTSELVHEGSEGIIQEEVVHSTRQDGKYMGTGMEKYNGLFHDLNVKHKRRRRELEK